MTDAQGELQTAVTAAIKDKSISSPELKQLRIFYEQASDLDALEAAGADELRPYLKAVADTQSLDELEAACPNFPMRETLAKLGEDTGENVIVMYPEWLSSFNEVWTEDNFELLRNMTEVKVLRECSDLLSPSFFAGTLLGNYLALKAYNDKLEAKLAGKPARACATWLYMRPTLQNCFYDPVNNSINIFPGYITSAIYSKGMSSEELLANAGFVIGHEISHAFDYSGSQFNAYGEPVAIFTDDDVKEFVAKRQSIADYYSTIEVTPDANVDGTSKSAEALADLCGLQAVLERAQNIKGFDYEKMFGDLARSWATVYSPSYADVLSVDAHVLNNLRVNVSVQMYDEFYATYGAAEGNTMYLLPEKRLVIWGKNSG